MGSNSQIKKVLHGQHVEYIEKEVEHVAWIRKQKVDIDQEMFANEIEGRGSGFIDLIISVCGIDAPGRPPMFGVGGRFVQVAGAETITGDVYYYSGFEVGSKLSHESMAKDRYHEEERVTAPPEWLNLPFLEDFEQEKTQEEEDVEGRQVDQNSKEEQGGQTPQ